MNDNIQAEFPAILVETDGSLGGLLDLEYWTDDVDQWFWSTGDAYLVDSRGRKFTQAAERRDGRPTVVPLWIFDSELGKEDLRTLFFADPSNNGKLRSLVSLRSGSSPPEWLKDAILQIIQT